MLRHLPFAFLGQGCSCCTSSSELLQLASRGIELTLEDGHFVLECCRTLLRYV